MCYEIEGNNIHLLSPEETLYRLYPEIKQIDEQSSVVLVKDTDDVIDK